MALPIAGSGRVPAGDFVWFVYGSSLDREAFADWAAQHGREAPDLGKAFPARLRGWRLCFDVASRYWGGVVGSLVPSPPDQVEGLALPMPAAGRELADHREGAATGLYQAVPVTIEPLCGGAPVSAVAYVASPSRRLASEGAPAPSWLEAVLRGANAAGLSPAWIAELERRRG